MGLDVIQPNNVPGVISALRWLMEMSEDEGANEVLDKASIEGFLSTEESLYWRANEGAVEHALQKHLPFPADIKSLASIVHGLGELAARCHGDFMTPLLDQLEDVLTHDDVTKFIGAAVTLSCEAQPNFNLQERSLAQAIIRSKLCWDTYYSTISLMEHRYHFISPKRYGFKFATKLVMHLYPDALCLWISSAGENPVLAAIIDAAIETLTSEQANNVAMPLMASQNDFLRCLAVASLVCPQGMHSSAELGFTECMESINKAGIPSSDGIWMAGFHLKEFIHEHYRLRDRIKGLNAQLQFLKNRPSSATSKLDFEKHEIISNEAQLEENEKKWVDLQAETEKILSEMAHCWPEQGLSAAQLNELEHLFVETAEFRHRLAEKVPHVENRTWLLKRNINSILEFIGIGKKLDEILEERFYFREEHHRDLLFWGSRSHLLRWEGDKRGAGKRLGDHIADLVSRLEELISEPFIINRKPNHWQSAVGRLACAHLFAIHVIDNTPENRHQEIEGLIPIVIEHSRHLLRALMDQWDIHHAPLHDQLAQSAVWLMKHNNLINERQNWIDDDLLCYPRALALWSNADSLNRKLDLGKELFFRVAQRPLSESEYTHYFNRLLTLLDLAVSTCAQAGDPQLLLQIQEIWDRVYLKWESVYGKQWKDTARWLIQALSSDGEDRQALLSDPSFGKSYCRALLPF